MSYDRRGFKFPTKDQQVIMKEVVAAAQQASKAAEGVLEAARGLETFLGGSSLPDKADFAKIDTLLQHYRKGVDLLSRTTAPLDGSLKDLKKII